MGPLESKEETMSLDVLERASKALIDLDAEVLVSLYDDHFVYEDSVTGERITDKKALKEGFQRLFSMPDVKFSEVEIFYTGERGAGKWTWSGKSTKTDQPFSIRGASLFKLHNNRIKEEIVYYDPGPASFDHQR
jgi:hypothetical protein